MEEAKKQAPRAQRFVMRIPLQYRRRGEEEWHEALIKNISRTGVLFQTADALITNAVIELNFQLPVAIGKEGAGRVFCEGEVVRTSLPLPEDPTFDIAASIRFFRLYRAGSIRPI